MGEVCVSEVKGISSGAAAPTSPEISMDDGRLIFQRSFCWQPLHQLVHGSNVVSFARLVLLRPSTDLTCHIAS